VCYFLSHFLLVVLTQDSDGRFNTQLHMLSEMGFTDSQANIEGKEISLIHLANHKRLWHFHSNIFYTMRYDMFCLSLSMF